MNDPIIVFCENGHIYDASLNEECPYCKKVSINKERLNSILDDEDVKNGAFAVVGEESDETELLIEDGDKTELLEEDADGEEGDKTELLIEEELSEETELENTGAEDSSKSEIKHLGQSTNPLSRVRNLFRIQSNTQDNDTQITEQDIPRSSAEYVRGWIICIDGAEKGKSYSLRNYNRLLLDIGTSSNQSEYIVLGYDSNSDTANKAIAEIAVNINGEFLLNIIGDERCLVDGIRFTSTKKLYPYAHIRIYNREYVFVPFVCDRFTWED